MAAIEGSAIGRYSETRQESRFVRRFSHEYSSVFESMATDTINLTCPFSCPHQKTGPARVGILVHREVRTADSHYSVLTTIWKNLLSDIRQS